MSLLFICLAAPAQDDISWLENDEIRFGANLSLGGAVTHLSLKSDGVNMINSHDWGRQIQMSFYSGPIPYEPDGHKPSEHWSFLGWNPIQSGDYFGNRSQILEHRNDGETIYVKCRPMHWPLNNRPGECLFECWYRLDGPVVTVTSRLTNQRDDETQYPGRSQELPAVYTNAPYHRLMTYDGGKPYVGEPMREIPKQDHSNGIRWAGWNATENWAALVNDDGVGLGVWHPGVFAFGGGFFGEPGQGGPQDSPTGYISPTHSEILDHNIVYPYEYVLIAGSLDEIRGYVYRHREAPALPAYSFVRNRQHFIYHGGRDEGWPIEGALNVTADGNDLQLIGPDAIWQAAPGHRMIIEAAITPADGREQVNGTLFFKTADNHNFAAERQLPFTLAASETIQTHVIDLGGYEPYQGAITGLRIDPFEPSQPGDRIQVKRIFIE